MWTSKIGRRGWRETFHLNSSRWSFCGASMRTFNWALYSWFFFSTHETHISECLTSGSHLRKLNTFYRIVGRIVLADLHYDCTPRVYWGKRLTVILQTKGRPHRIEFWHIDIFDLVQQVCLAGYRDSNSKRTDIQRGKVTSKSFMFFGQRKWN